MSKSDSGQISNTGTRRSDLPCPYIKRDCIQPTRGMDGRIHTSLSSYRKSLKADGNPYHQNFMEIGNEKTNVYKAPSFDRQKRRNDIRKAMSEVPSF